MLNPLTGMPDLLPTVYCMQKYLRSNFVQFCSVTKFYKQIKQKNPCTTFTKWTRKDLPMLLAK